MNFNKIVIIGIILLYSISTFAQADTIVTPKKKNKFYFGMFTNFGVDIPNIDANGMNAELAKYNYPNMKFDDVVVNVGFHWYVNKYILNFNFGGNVFKDESTKAFSNTTFETFNVSFGYNVLPRSQFQLYPFVGYNQNSFRYTYNERIANNSTQAAYLLSNLDYKDMTNIQHSLLLGAGFTFQKSVLFQVRAGYNLTFKDKGWTIQNNTTKLAEAATITHPYFFSVSLGIGSSKG